MSHFAGDGDVEGEEGTGEEGEGGEGSDIKCCEDGGVRSIREELRHPECLPIQVPARDPFYSRFGRRCMEFVRSMPAERPECNLGPREQVLF